MPDNLKRAVAVVTGATSGIGLIVANAFLAAGYDVATVARRPLEPISDAHVHFTADLSCWSECKKVCAELVEVFGTVDVLVNNVGKSEWRELSGIDEKFFNEIMHLNVQSYVAMTKYLLPAFADEASVINMSSLAGKRGSANNSIYCASKFAVNGLTQAWAKELGPRHIRVNAVCPVLVRSDGLDTALVGIGAPAERVGIDAFLDEFSSAQTALGRLPVATEVSDLCLYLASARASAITGQCINVDCGVFPQ